MNTDISRENSNHSNINFQPLYFTNSKSRARTRIKNYYTSDTGNSKESNLEYFTADASNDKTSLERHIPGSRVRERARPIAIRENAILNGKILTQFLIESNSAQTDSNISKVIKFDSSKLKGTD